jgi:type IV pilus assembly protein PilN
MIRINLLPFRLARKKENIRRQVSIFILLLVFSTILLFYSNRFWNNQIFSLSQEVDHLKHELKVATTAANEVDKIQKELADLESKCKVIDTLKANRREPVELMDAMTQLVVARRMWFTSFADVGMNVNIKGVALDNPTVANFMSRLEQSGLFSAVNLVDVKQQKINKLNLMSFNISCQKAPPKSTAKSEAKVS